MVGWLALWIGAAMFFGARFFDVHRRPAGSKVWRQLIMNEGWNDARVRNVGMAGLVLLVIGVVATR